jgi:hypothetical protein
MPLKTDCFWNTGRSRLWTNPDDINMLFGYNDKGKHRVANGISAIAGFDYQATVTLELLLEFFDRSGTDAEVRPEDVDDLTFYPAGNPSTERCFVQVKKPRETSDGKPNPSPWTVAHAAEELFPDTVRRLAGNGNTQTWVLGDSLNDALALLIESGSNAPAQAPRQYFHLLHALTCQQIADCHALDAVSWRRFRGWRPAADIDGSMEGFRLSVRSFATEVRMGEVALTAYLREAAKLDFHLPSVISRTAVRSNFGSEAAVTSRVNDLLQHRYSLSRPVVEKTLFRNLRGFINDIAKQPERRFGVNEFDLELLSVWPDMIPIKTPPPLEFDHIPRRDLVEAFVDRPDGGVLELMGASGSGKTSLATEMLAYSHANYPNRRAFYAEVRPGRPLRDVLCGVAFHLRRVGITKPFTLAVQTGITDEERISQLASAFSKVDQEILILVDLVEGGCGPQLARDLATFVRSLGPTGCWLACFGQESALRELNRLEREEASVAQIDVRGLGFEEFVILVGHRHQTSDRTLLHHIYQRATAGRAAGLLPALAHSLSRAPSLERMTEIVSLPADEILGEAERQRFARLTEGSRTAAERLVCFALPFTPEQAEQVFPKENIGRALHEMRSLGLIRMQSDGSFEMHEVIRAGIESGISPDLRRTTHGMLADWYASCGTVTAEVLHLEQAGRQDEAAARARAAFLQGKQWEALSAYVKKHRLVSFADVLQVVAGDTPIEDRFALRSILRGLGEPVDVQALVDVLRSRPERSASDFTWTQSILEAIMEFEPARLNELVRFEVERGGDPVQLERTLDILMVAVRHTRVPIEPATLELFKRQDPDGKARLFRFLLLDWRREVLEVAFEYLSREHEGREVGSKAFSWRYPRLCLDNPNDVVEFLGAIPVVEVAKMVTARSALLGHLSQPVWSKRRTLRQSCFMILEDASSHGERVLTGAIRVLVSLGDPSVGRLCEPMIVRTDTVGLLSRFVPVLVPALHDLVSWAHRAADPGIEPDIRATAMFALAAAGGSLREVRQLMDAGQKQVWDPLLLMLCGQSPFEDAIPLAYTRLDNLGTEAALFVPTLLKLGELETPEATDLLLKALSNPAIAIRNAAAIGLAKRRSSRALDALKLRRLNEKDSVTRALFAAAIIASGARSSKDVLVTSDDDPSSRMWHFVLTSRVGDAAAASEIAIVASDQSHNWQIRRSAIYAAGRLEFSAALGKFHDTVMAERWQLHLDRSSSLHCHFAIVTLLQTGAAFFLDGFIRGKHRFIELSGDLIDKLMTQQMNAYAVPKGVDAAGWLYDRLAYHGWPDVAEAPNRVLDEIHVPVLQKAVLRSLRLAGQPQLIESHLSRAIHPWLAIRCLLERSRAGNHDPKLRSRLRDILDTTPLHDDQRLAVCLNEAFATAGTPRTFTLPTPTSVPEPKPLLSYAEAARMLATGKLGTDQPSVIVLAPLQADEMASLIHLADPVNDVTVGV